MIVPKRIAVLASGERDELGAALLHHLFVPTELAPLVVDRVDLRCPMTHAMRDRLAHMDAIVFAGGSATAALVENTALIEQLPIHLERQVVGAQCNGALFLSALGLLAHRSVATDAATRPLLEARGHHVVGSSFTADESVASAGGAFASPFLAAWVAWRLAGPSAATAMLEESAPVGQRREFAERHLRSLASIAPGKVERRLVSGRYAIIRAG